MRFVVTFPIGDWLSGRFGLQRTSLIYVPTDWALQTPLLNSAHGSRLEARDWPMLDARFR